MNEERHLYVIPIAHRLADMGSLRDQIPLSEEYETAATKYWVEVGRYVRNTFINGVKVDKVYQDGIPDFSEEIVAEMVTETQTANYEILRWLKSQGALIRGTEDHALILKEGRISETFPNPPQDRETWSKTTKAFAEVLVKRDDYIAQRIQQDLLLGETGILFIGALHDVSRRLRKIMCVIEPEELLAKFPKAYSETRRV